MPQQERVIKRKKDRGKDAGRQRKKAWPGVDSYWAASVYPRHFCFEIFQSKKWSMKGLTCAISSRAQSCVQHPNASTALLRLNTWTTHQGSSCFPRTTREGSRLVSAVNSCILPSEFDKKSQRRMPRLGQRPPADAARWRKPNRSESFTETVSELWTRGPPVAPPEITQAAKSAFF